MAILIKIKIKISVYIKKWNICAKESEISIKVAVNDHLFWRNTNYKGSSIHEKWCTYTNESKMQIRVAVNGHP